MMDMSNQEQRHRGSRRESRDQDFNQHQNKSLTGTTVSFKKLQARVGSYFNAFGTQVKNLISANRTPSSLILLPMDGLVRCSEMLLVLGRPGSGSSTFLKTIAGNTHGFAVSEDAVINYEGIPYHEMHAEHKAETRYVAEMDIHFPELTLGQTLEFAVRARPRNAHSPQYITGNAISVASLFNLQQSFDTLMGNDMIRGVSGGEKKRVSIAEAYVGGSPIQCWDKCTRGLDSSTALDFVKLLRSTADEQKSTVMVSIYQTSEAMYNCFDKVMLLYEGRQIYFGPISTAAQYFTALGFVHQPRCTTADFLTSVTAPAERIIAKDFENSAPRSAEDFERCWQQSLERSALAREIEEFNAMYPPIQSKKYSSFRWVTRYPATRFALSPGQQVTICLKRALQRLRNNSSATISAILGNAIIGIIIGSIFYDLDESSASMDRRALLIFFSIMLNACASGYEILTIWAQRPIVEKHDRYSFSLPVTEAIASMICDLPNKILTSLLFSVAVYFMSNLRRTPGAFFVFYVFSFAALLTMSMVFRMMGSLSKRIEQSMAPGAIMTINFLIYTGFVVPVPYMVPWFGWMRFINPIAYAYESLMINEFNKRSFPCTNFVPSGPGYSSVGMEFKTCNLIGARPGEGFVEGSDYVLEKYAYRAQHLWRNFGLLLALMIGYCAIYLLGVALIPVEKGKGEVLLFPRHVLRKDKMNEDEEQVVPNETIIDAVKDEVSVVDCSPEENLFASLQKHATEFTWSNLCYNIRVSGKKSRPILQDIDGWVKQGSLTALMGATGAGKTTLLDVLSSRVSQGTTTGDIRMNGTRRDQSFQRETGYVQQADVHVPTATVREALLFSALLRQPNTRPACEKRQYVDHILRVLDMKSYAEAVIGVPGEGLNVEQRRRLSIAVELVARPERLLFLDEPTSGLDSQTAWSICTLLRRLADSGIAVLCTIHQPSSQLLAMFDQLLLLEQGGRTLYFGDLGHEGSSMISYFEKNGARGIKADENPAEWMLDVTGATPSSQNHILWADTWSRSLERQKVRSNISEILDKQQDGTNPNLSLQTYEHAASYMLQFRLVLKRLFQEYWRTPEYIYSKIALCTGVAFFNGFSFYMMTKDIQGITNVIFSIFILTVLYGNVAQQIIPRFVSSRALFEAREMRSKTFSWAVFVASHIAVELVWQTVTSLLVFVAWYFPIGLWRNGNDGFATSERAGILFLFVWGFCLFTSTFTHAIGAAIEHAETAVSLLQLLIYLCIIFCGVLVKPLELPRFWKFMYRVSPLTYLIQGMASASLGDTAITCSPAELLFVEPPSGENCTGYLSEYTTMVGGYISNPDARDWCQICPVGTTNTILAKFDIDVGARWRYFGIFCLYCVVNIGATFLFFWLARVPKAAHRRGT
ncbi:AtrD, ABC-transporter [Lophiotrema nucula]|uniref:AtrD, ABC-transporter n=1 Tax=Lophiotrema nucula TaxID=690887 RepID=A0A6A5ZS35_9PLEO|nr:AtrD, ABC-transporter [Lophiotrema nucula]